MDFIVGLAPSQGKEVIFVVVDRFTKYAHFMTLSHPYSVAQVASVFLEFDYKLHGCPTTIVSNQHLFFLAISGNPLIFQIAWSTISNVYCLSSSVWWANWSCGCMAADRPSSWVKWLSLVEYWYNTTHHTAIGITPFHALYGFPPPLNISYVLGDSKVVAVDELLQAREETSRMVRHHLLRAINRMKQYADRRRSDWVFQVGDWVFLKLHPFQQQSVRSTAQTKLSPKYFGPYLVLERVGSVAYRLDLPSSTLVHPTFHVSLMKKTHGIFRTVHPLPADCSWSTNKPIVSTRDCDWKEVG